MKKQTLLFLFLLFTTAQITNAQIKKGTGFLGGSVGVGFFKSESEPNKTKQTSVSISPAYGIFTKDNIVWGGDLIFSHVKSDNGLHDIYQKQNYAGIGVFVRQYLPIANRFYLYGQARLGGNHLWEDRTTATETTKGRGYGISLSLHPGISYSLKKNIYLEAGFNNLVSVDYGHMKQTLNNQNGTSSTKSNSFGLNGNLSGAAEIAIGLRFMIERS